MFTRFKGVCGLFIKSVEMLVKMIERGKNVGDVKCVDTYEHCGN